MPFAFTLSDEVKAMLREMGRRDQTSAQAVNKKIKQIINCDENTIDHYKNLRHGLSDYKRVHVAKCFVLSFKVYKKEKFILFESLRHHDDAYK